jgi:hypothetical protein
MESVTNLPSSVVGVIFVAIVLYASSIITMRVTRRFPMVGIDSLFKHRLAVNYKFFSNAEDIINDGYQKASPMQIIKMAYLTYLVVQISTLGVSKG